MAVLCDDTDMATDRFVAYTNYPKKQIVVAHRKSPKDKRGMTPIGSELSDIITARNLVDYMAQGRELKTTYIYKCINCGSASGRSLMKLNETEIISKGYKIFIEDQIDAKGNYCYRAIPCEAINYLTEVNREGGFLSLLKKGADGIKTFLKK